jgi:hypothetical protein
VAAKSEESTGGGTGMQSRPLINSCNSKGKRRWEIQSQYWTFITEAIEKDRVTKGGKI